MKYTSNYGLNKPEPAIDNVNIDVLNSNMDIVDKGLVVYLGVTSGDTNAYTITTHIVKTLSEGLPICVKFHTAATAACTLDINEWGAKAIKKAGGSDANNLKAGIYTLRYDGQNFILQGEGGGSGDMTASDLLSGKTGTSDAGEIVGTMPIAPTYPDNFTSIDFQVYGNKDWANGHHNVFMRPPRGYFDETKWVGFNEPNLHPDNLKKGVRVGSAGAYIEGAYTGDGQFLNFPVSIIGTNDALPASGDSVGHICIKNSNLASQITSIKILEALNAGDPDGTLTFVVSDLAGCRNYSITQQKKLTSGGNMMTLDIADISGSVAQNSSYWRASYNPAGGSASLWLSKPMVYSKLGGVVDIETSYMWDGVTWQLLCQKGSYAIIATNLSNADAIKVYNKIGDAFTFDTNLPGGSSSTTIVGFSYSRDGSYLVLPPKIYRRVGYAYSLYATLPLTIAISSFTYELVKSDISANGSRIAAGYIDRSYNRALFVIFDNTGTSFVQGVTLDSEAGTTYALDLAISPNGNCVMTSAHYEKNSIFFYNGATWTKNYVGGWMARGLMFSYDSAYVYCANNQGSSPKLYRYELDYANRVPLPRTTVMDLGTFSGNNHLIGAHPSGIIMMRLPPNTPDVIYCWRTSDNSSVTVSGLTYEQLLNIDIDKRFAFSSDGKRALICNGTTYYYFSVDVVGSNMKFTLISSNTIPYPKSYTALIPL